MSGDAWPADPTDPRCPACGEPVSATATYCLHCEADLPTAEPEAASAGATGTPDDGADDADPAADADSWDVLDGPGSDPADDGGPLAGGDAAATPGAIETGTETPSGADREGGAEARRWLHPDGLLDDASTVAVGAAGGLVVAVLATVLAAFATESASALLVGVVLWPGVGLYVAYARTVFGAARKAAYLLAATLAALPLFWFTPPVQGGTLGGRVLAFAVTEVVVVPVALLLAGAGHRVGRMAPDG